MNYRSSLVAARSTNVRLLVIAGRYQYQATSSHRRFSYSHHLPHHRVATAAAVIDHERRDIRSFDNGIRYHFQSTSAAAAHSTYKKPKTVELWEELASKELAKSTMTVESLRTERVTPVRITRIDYKFEAQFLIYYCQ